MSIIDKYYLWENRIETRPIRRSLIEFFKTKPTFQQVELIDLYIRRKYIELILMGCMYSFLLGVFVGILI